MPREKMIPKAPVTKTGQSELARTVELTRRLLSVAKSDLPATPKNTKPTKRRKPPTRG